MENENKQEVKQPQGWKDVNLVPDMPLSALVGFLNVLNQRLCTIENLITIKKEDGTEISLTDFYAEQNEQNSQNENKGE